MNENKKVISANFKCKHCHKLFTLENRYLKHKCKQMIRIEEFQSPQGQLAFTYYCLWMRCQKRLAPQASAFMSSKSFVTFMNFAKFAQSVSLVKVDKFIKLMVDKDYPPFMWTSDEIYSLYLNYMQHNTSPKEHFAISLETLMSISEKNDIDVADVFELLQPTEIIRLMRIRKLSPWLLLFSKKFKKMLVERASPEQQQIIDNLIQPNIWVDLLAKYSNEKEQIKTYIATIGL